jgi:hypothetical protein
VKAWESQETAGDKVESRASSTSVDNRKGARLPREGQAIPCEGKTLKGGIPGTVAARNKAAKLGLARKPLGG